MVGQEHLLEKLNKYTIDTLPKSLLFLGPSGSGRHTIINYIAAKFKFNVVELQNKITYDDIISYQQNVLNTAYIININNFDEKKQSQLLKFIEEPGKTVYIMLIAESETSILDTILNRCIKYKLEQYTKDQLQRVLWINAEIDPLAYEVCKTPGQIQSVSGKNIQSLKSLCDNIINNIDKVNYNNLLTVVNKINFSEEYDKYDMNLFFEMITYCAYNNYLATNSKISLNIYLFTIKFKSELVGKNMNKEQFMLNYFTRLYEVGQNES